MWRKLLLSFLLLFAVSCAREEPVQNYFYLQDPGEELYEQARFEVSLDPAAIDEFYSLEKAFWEHGADKCFTINARKVINREPLVRPGRTGSPGSGTGFVRTSGEIEPVQASMTDAQSQEFTCLLSTIPHWSLAGEIVAFDKDKTIAATRDKIDIELFDRYPEKGPAYFFVARRTEREGRLLLKVFGSGKLQQVLQSDTQMKRHENSSGTLGRGVILETRREIKTGDLILLSYLSLEGVHEEDEHEYQEVQVEPTMRISPEKEDQSPENDTELWRKK